MAEITAAFALEYESITHEGDTLSAELSQAARDDKTVIATQNGNARDNLTSAAVAEILEISSPQASDNEADHCDRSDKVGDNAVEEEETKLNTTDMTSDRSETSGKASVMDSKEQDWVSIQVPSCKQGDDILLAETVPSSFNTIEDHCGGGDEKYGKADLGNQPNDGSESFMRSDQGEWVSVEAPVTNSICSFPCSLVEWITVDMPSNSAGGGHESMQRVHDNMRMQEHVCVRLFEEEKREGCYQKSSAGPTTRKRRTISGKIRARIEAYENTAQRQELDRLNSPLAKAKNRRISSAAEVTLREIQLRRATKLKELHQKLKELQLKKATPEDEDDGGESKLRLPEDGGLVQEQEEKQQEIVSEAKLVASQEVITEKCSVDAAAAAKTDEEYEWELTGKCVQQDGEAFQSKDAEEEESCGSAELERYNQSAGGIGVGGLMKQVISGAALLAGLIFLWPRGNNSIIWRCGWVGNYEEAAFV